MHYALAAAIIVLLVVVVAYLSRRKGPLTTIPIQHYTINPDGSVSFVGTPTPPVSYLSLVGRSVTLTVGQYGTKASKVVSADGGSDGRPVHVNTAPGAYPGPFLSNDGAPGNVAVIS